MAVGSALADHGIRAVLTGGACASIHSDGSYVSADLDFVIQGRVTPTELDAAMASVGFRRHTNRYVHAASSFWVEFPRGPLAVGADLDVKPEPLERNGVEILVLSPSDSCRDRLAAFYHWNDRQSLEVALRIASRNRIDLQQIRRWSEGEGHAKRFEEFASALARRRATKSRARSK